MSLIKYLFVIISFAVSTSVKSQSAQPESNTEPYRPQIHFSPEKGWMNDPNGMVYYKNVYHLFYQYYPDGTVWGPMHWGHATSKDLMHWQHKPIALYPDSLGYIFSGSAVADIHNTSGFGENGHVPLIAIFTYHNPKEEKAGRNDFQYQGIAYSLDSGKTWTKYAGNPVLKNPGIRDFRDPKVSWYEPAKKWIMTLATLDHITFYSSPDLKNWKMESAFGKDIGAHGGVWECPDLFPLDYKDKKIWVLIVNLNPGGPNGGSATQYFLGDFDGKEFNSFTTETKWLDYGPDEYAGVTWSNTGRRKIFLGWMSNWQYANVVPTVKWRGATTIPRDLRIEKLGNEYFVSSMPVPELSILKEKTTTLKNVNAADYNLSAKTGKLTGPVRLNLSSEKIESFSLILSNKSGENVQIGYDKATNNYFIDRTRSGKVSFEKGFAKKHIAPRLAKTDAMNLTLIIDKASVELFADNGLTVMTSIFFPDTPFTDISFKSGDNFKIKTLEVNSLKSIIK